MEWSSQVFREKLPSVLDSFIMKQMDSVKTMTRNRISIMLLYSIAFHPKQVSRLNSDQGILTVVIYNFFLILMISLQIFAKMIRSSQFASDYITPSHHIRILSVL